MADTKRIMFVCTGNTCRSPMAEGLFRKAVQSRTDYEVSSAGVSASDGGKINPQSALILAAHDASIEQFRSSVVTSALLERATHVFAMTASHLDHLRRRFPAHESKLYLACEFVDLPGVGIGADVPDPIGMGPEAYHEVADILNAAIPTIIAYLDQTASSPAGDA